ncbi:GDSL-type esterase/lipase family protein [Roseibium sp. SCP14]|uniref:GDSL-type esterase/lipase family protein n=1 Tax=Roseibium sp. SCP14 TaxID=3141375 RepID=UPI003334AECC
MTKRILVYGDSNTWGWKGVEEAFPTDRYGDDERWAGVMAAELGNEFSVAIDGLTVRSTNLDDSLDWNQIKAEAFNGAKTLPAAIAREMPLDLVIIMLGTNDLKAECNRSAEDIAEAVIELAGIVANSAGGVAYTYGPPRCLVVAPPALNDLPHPDFAAMFEGGREKSERLGAALEAAAGKAGVAFFDAGSVVPRAAGTDGLHMSAEQHNALGTAMAEVVRRI